ncbi:hypothetical protein [Furfurilactobacillus entadae]|uniref:hypothetical protein n=1 Tax=Furfurilactobacillus entadae TaxID=2922307 RepID=UPI0035E6B920
MSNEDLKNSIGLLISVPIVFFDGAVLAQGWNWIIVPGFNQKPITYAVAVGVEALIVLLKPSAQNTDNKSLLVIEAETLVTLAMVLLILWICHLFIG